MRKSMTLAVLALATLLACAREPRLCEVCQRSIHAGIQATVLLESGRRVDACCPRCAMHYRDTSPDRAARIEVTDYDGGSSLPLEDAFLVEGSDQTPCLDHHPIADETRRPLRICYDRCMPSLIAFRSESKARAFIAEHGGTLAPPGSMAVRPAH